MASSNVSREEHHRCQLLRLPDVVKLIGVQRSTLYAWIRQRRFPSPIRIGARASAWRLDEIERFIEETTVASRREAAAAQ